MQFCERGLREAKAKSHCQWRAAPSTGWIAHQFWLQATSKQWAHLVIGAVNVNQDTAGETAGLDPQSQVAVTMIRRMPFLVI